MQKIKRARAAATVLVILWLLLGLSIISNSNAENIPLSKEGLEKIGLNKVRLESGIGVIVFNLSESYDKLEADGYLTVSNTYNASVIISCRIITKLSAVDLDESGMFRVHKKISDNVIFKPIPAESWITLEDDKAVIDPHSVYNFRYAVDIPLSSEDSFDTSEGYLLYINVRKDLGNATGVQIGIDYDYKLFIIFTGELKQENLVFSLWMLLLIPIPIVGGTLILYKNKKLKKVKVIPNANSIHVNNPGKTIKNKPILDDDAIRQRLDNILERRNG